jgi:sugar (pentulose or hexulose) kinase
VISKSGARPEEVVAVGNSGHGNGVYLLDKKRQPLRNGSVIHGHRAADIVTDGMRAISIKKYFRLQPSPFGQHNQTAILGSG